MKIIKNILIIGAVAVVSLLGSCNKAGEEFNGGEPLRAGDVAIELLLPTGNPASQQSATRAEDLNGTPEEKFIDKVQMAIVNAETGDVVRYIAIDPAKPVIDEKTVWNASTSTLTMRGVNSTDKFIVYAMANGTGDELETATTKEAIMAKIVEHRGAITDIAKTPLPMSGISAETTFAADHSTEVTVQLTRAVAKVNVKVVLNGKFLTDYTNLKFGTADAGEAALSIINAPHKTYLYPQSPVALPVDALDANDVWALPTAESGADKDMIWTTTAYVYENPTTDAATAMKIGLNLPYKDGTLVPVTNNYYEVVINHAVTKDRIIRNHIYTVTITVNGFGYNNAVDVATTVASWEDGGYDDEIPLYKFSVDRRKIEFQHIIGQQTVNITTNTNSWKLVNKVGGATILSPSENITEGTIDGIKYTLGGTENAPVITIEKLTEGEIVEQLLTFVCGNLKFPFTVNYK